MKRWLNDIFKLKKSIFVKNPGEDFTSLKISANQRFGTYADVNGLYLYRYHKDRGLLIECLLCEVCSEESEVFFFL